MTMPRPSERARRSVIEFVIAIAATLVLVTPPLFALQGRVLHVNAETGSDANDGSLGAPFKRVNTGLQKAWDSLQSPSIPDVSAVWVHASAVPIAPSPVGTFGGYEDKGWKNSPSDPDPPPFPIRLIGGVDLVGVRQGANKPVIMINETLSGPAYTNWSSSIPRCLVLADGLPAAATMSSFKLDGEPLDSTMPSAAGWSALIVRNTAGFTLAGCDISDFHDNMYCEATGTNTLRVTINGCVLEKAGPLSALDPSSGHASFWQVGTGTTVLTVQDTTFRGSHDAVEIVGSPGSEHTFTATGCRFEGNENGLEVVGSGGMIELTVTDSVFLDCYNIGTDEGGVDDSTAAIVARMSGSATVNATVRECDFRNSAFGVVWDVPQGVLDLGTAASHGRNNFCLDFGPFVIIPTPSAPAYPSDDPYRVCLYNRTSQTVTAVGNWWYRNNHGASSQGVMTIGLMDASSGGGVNLYSTDPIASVPLDPPAPPGPFWGEFEATGLRWLRNYAIAAGGAIDFGDEFTAPVGSPPDCAVAP